MASSDIRFEYHVIHLKPAFIGGISDETLQTALNDAGREGWELGAGSWCKSCTRKTPIWACTWCSRARADADG